jgi:L-lactate utilization protein LutB
MARRTEYSAIHMLREVPADNGKWSRIPAPDLLERTVRAIGERGIRVVVAEDAAQALQVVRDLIPPGSELMQGSSVTLAEIGFDELAAGGSMGWRSLHAAITSENDSAKRATLRRKAVAADYFISSANAIASTGEIVACDASGSRVGAWPFAAGHLIIVAGANKIVPTLDDAFQRIREYVYPLESARAKRVYGTPSSIGKCVVLAREAVPGRVILVLVKEEMGY